MASSNIKDHSRILLKGIGMLLLLVLFITPAFAQGIPKIMEYAGQLTSPAGTPLPAGRTYTVRFNIVDPVDNVLWEEEHSIEITAKNKQAEYKIVLGETNAIELPFNEDYRIRVFNISRPPGYLIEEKDIASAGYAYRSEFTNYADTVFDSSDNTYKDVSTIKVIEADDTDTLDGKHASEFGDTHSLDAADGNPVDAVYVDSGGNVGIGITDPGSKVEVVSGSTNAKLGYFFERTIDLGPMSVKTHNYLGVKGAYGEVAIGYLGYQYSTPFALFSPKYYYGVYGSASESASDNSLNFGVYGSATSSNVNYGVYGSASGGTENWAGYFSGAVYASGNIGIGTKSPRKSLEIAGTGLRMVDENPSSVNDYGDIRFADGGGGGLTLNSRTGGGWADISFQTNGTTQMFIESNGNVGIGTTSPEAKLMVSGDGSSWSEGFIFINNNNNDAGMRLYNGNNPKWHIFNNHVSDILHITSQTNYPYGGVTIQQSGEVSCPVLRITGGSDIAEPFDVENPLRIKPGMVVVIDERIPGKLKISEKEYDSCVAGIISGASGIKPGIMMSQEESVANGKFPVALTGRVYVWASTSNGSIKPGNLLTTSSIPGHAMKVTEHARAQGAILGKAMSSLEEGEGLVLALVTLQ